MNSQRLMAPLRNDRSVVCTEDDEIWREHYSNNSVTIFPNFINFNENYIRQFPAGLSDAIETATSTDYNYERNDTIVIGNNTSLSGSSVRKYVLMGLLTSAVMMSAPLSIDVPNAEVVKGFTSIATQIFPGAQIIENGLASVNGSTLWFSKVIDLDKQGMENHVIDVIFAHVNEMHQNGKFSDVDDLLNSIDIKQYSITVLLALLTITLCAKGMLNQRGRFFEKVKQQLIETNSYDDTILIGLD